MCLAYLYVFDLFNFAIHVPCLDFASILVFNSNLNLT